jgi:hypothetical protein
VKAPRDDSWERVGVRRDSGDIAEVDEDYVERGRWGRWTARARQAERQPIHLIHLGFEDTGLSTCRQLVDAYAANGALDGAA